MSESPELSEAITALDDHLFVNREGTIRLDSTADLLEIDPSVLTNLLELYEQRGVVTSNMVPICTECDIPIEAEGATIRCDLCDNKYVTASLTKETIYRPRNTNFECGDDFSRTIPTSYEVDGLFQISGCSNEDREADVVFVHGLGGDAKQTWHPDGHPDKFWPKWLGEKLPNVGVWSLDYEAAKMKWNGDALPLSDRAKDVLGRLMLGGIGSRPIIFVTHSLGGLVVKQLLRHAKEMAIEDWTAIGESTCGIVFIATPHSGSDLSGYMSMVSTFARPTAAVADLEAHHPRLRELNEWFRNNFAALRMRVTVLYETKKTMGITVVNATSADPGLAGVPLIPIEADHITICKPESTTSLVYLHTLRLVEQCIIAAKKKK